MSNGMLVRLVPLAGCFAGSSYTSGGFSAAFPISNLANPQPKVVMQTLPWFAVWNVVLDIDLGVDTDVDTIAVLFTNMSAGAGIWKVYGATAAHGLGAAGTETSGDLAFGFTGTGWVTFGVAPTTRNVSRSALATAETTPLRYIRIYMQDDPAYNPEGITRIGIVAVGQRWLPMWNFETGGGRRIDDRSTMRELPGGELGGMRAAKVPIVRLTWGDLSDAELLTLWSIMLEVGESEPILLVEDYDPTTGLIERMVYGTLSGLDFWERGDSNKSRIELRLKAWL